eukprot:m51a1_g3778 hypothetical protein (634) ;mRNA; r:153097-156209
MESPKDSPPRPGQDEWRATPGYVFEVLESRKPPEFCNSQFAQYQVLLGQFLFSESPSPLTDKPLFSECFDWGKRPLEKVVWGAKELRKIALTPFTSRNSVSIIEPFEHVGLGEDGRGVRASKNIAYLLQLVANCDAVLYPLWNNGVGTRDQHSLSLNQLVPVISASRAVIVEGGYGCVYDPETWKGPLKLGDMLSLVQNLVLNRTQMGSPSIFICLGHQLANEVLTQLVIKAIDEVCDTCEQQGGDNAPEWLLALRHECRKIHKIGSALEIKSRNGGQSLVGYRHPRFTVSANDRTELGSKTLCPFIPLDETLHPLPRRLTRAHSLTAHRYAQYNLLSTITRKYGVKLDMIMFHGDRVNYEAVLFDNWALSRLHYALIVHRLEVVRSPLSWMLNLPCGVEICASTMFQEGGDGRRDSRIHTAVAATTIYYEDFETTSVQASFCLQFHPELCDGIKVAGDVQADGNVYRPSFSELKHSDGVKLLCRMLHVAALAVVNWISSNSVRWDCDHSAASACAVGRAEMASEVFGVIAAVCGGIALLVIIIRIAADEGYASRRADVTNHRKMRRMPVFLAVVGFIAAAIAVTVWPATWWDKYGGNRFMGSFLSGQEHEEWFGLQISATISALILAISLTN